MEKSAQDGLINKSGNLIEPEKLPLATRSPTTSDNEAGSDKEPESKPESNPENLWGKRTRVLGRSVGISAKLGELYADEHVLQSDVAGERLIWAVETILKELQRRQVEGVKEGEGDWMSLEEIGGALEGMFDANIVMWICDVLCNGMLTHELSSRKPLRIQVTALPRSAAFPAGYHVITTEKLSHSSLK